MSDSTRLPESPELMGTAKDGKYEVRSGDGRIVDGGRAIFPILRQEPNGAFDLLGTGFFISTVGLFLTARHVLEAPFDRKTGKELFPISMIHFYKEGHYLQRPILRCAFHDVADIAIGVVAPMSHPREGPLTNVTLSLTTDLQETGSRVTTFAYPRYASNVDSNGGQSFHVMPSFYDGEIVEHLPNGRDRVMLPGPCYRTTMVIHGGASGGPVFSPDGRVFALNSTGWEDTAESYISSLEGIFDLNIDDVAISPGASPRTVSVREIVAAGHILMNKPPMERTDDKVS